MTDKPSYIGLLNAIALGERRAAEYLNCWSSVTPDPDVRALLHTIALREAEHGLVFEKRLDELGYGLVDRPDPDQARKMAVAASTTLCDREKLEQLDLCRTPAEGQSDVFDRFFQNKDIDPVTGGLLGRYIAEERDTNRRFAACHQALCSSALNTSEQNTSAQNTSAQKTSAQNNGGTDLSVLADQVAAVGRQLAELVRTIGTAASSGRA